MNKGMGTHNDENKMMIGQNNIITEKRIYGF